jgi:hypothetical protein
MKPLDLRLLISVPVTGASAQTAPQRTLAPTTWEDCRHQAPRTVIVIDEFRIQAGDISSF